MQGAEPFEKKKEKSRDRALVKRKNHDSSQLLAKEVIFFPKEGFYQLQEKNENAEYGL